MLRTVVIVLIVLVVVFLAYRMLGRGGGRRL
jgi:hypothetical protein